MKAKLVKLNNSLHHFLIGVRVNEKPNAITGDTSKIYGNATSITGDVSKICGDVSNINGNVTGISGCVTNIIGNVTGISGNVDDCEIINVSSETLYQIFELIG